MSARHPQTGQFVADGTELSVWLLFDEPPRSAPDDDYASHEANIYADGDGYRVDWCHTGVGLITSVQFDTYRAAAAWLEAGGYQDFSS